MLRGHDDQRSVVEICGFELRDDPAELPVDKRNRLREPGFWVAAPVDVALELLHHADRNEARAKEPGHANLIFSKAVAASDLVQQCIHPAAILSTAAPQRFAKRVCLMHHRSSQT